MKSVSKNRSAVSDKNTILQIEDLHKVFDQSSPHPVEAVKGVSFNVQENQLTVLLGPSGW